MAPSASVNVPTNTKIKEQDVNNKLQLYGIFSGKLFHRCDIISHVNMLTCAPLSLFQWQGPIKQAN